MESSPTVGENIIREGLTRLAAQHWAALGVFLQADRPPHAVIDPEALIWCTLEAGRSEARLFDETVEWLQTHAPRVNVHRLRAIGPDSQDVRWRILSAVAEKVRAKARSASWRGLAAIPQRQQATPEALFLARDGRGLPVYSGPPDPDFEARGIRRSPFRPRGRSARLDLKRPWSLLLSARALFGAKAAAEVLTALLTRQEATASSLADLTGYTARQINTVLDGFVECGVCQRAGKAFVLTSSQTWEVVFDLSQPPCWPNWRRLFEGLIALWRTWQDGHNRRLSDYLFASALRDTFIERKQDFAGSRIEVTCPAPDLYPANEFLPPFRRYIGELLDKALFLPQAR